MRMQLTLSAEKLKNVGGKFRDRVSDPYAEVIISGGPYEGTIVGRTETIENNLSPEWTTVLFVDMDDRKSYMPFRVTILDDNDGRDDKVMAEADFVDVLSVHQNAGHQECVEVRGGGKVYATVTQSVRGNEKGSLELQLRGLDIKNVELGVLQLGVSDPFIEIRKKSADHAAGVVRWIPVYRSETIMDNLNPFWEPINLGLEELCNCDTDWPLKITVLDWQRNGKHREIGSVETTVRGLLSRISTRGNADRENALTVIDDVKKKARGLIVVVSAKVVHS